MTEDEEIEKEIDEINLEQIFIDAGITSLPSPRLEELTKKQIAADRAEAARRQKDKSKH